VKERVVRTQDDPWRARTPRLQVESLSKVADEINEVRLRTAAMMNEWVLPNESLLMSTAEDDAGERATIETNIRAEVKLAGLWAPHLPQQYGGMGVGFLSHAYMQEIIGYSTIAGALFGIVAPNAGNAHLLVEHGTEEQKQKWLEPLAAGQLESGFSMTERGFAGSDPRSIATTAVRDGDEWCINGHKWFTSNGVKADVLFVTCRSGTESDAPLLQILVPRNTPGVELVRRIPIWGQGPSDHCEFRYSDVRVPLENAIGGGLSGNGEAQAQSRLGAGRIFHCMYAVGQMTRAFHLMVERIATRDVRGGPLSDKQFVQGFIAESYADIQSARLLTIHAAEQIDAGAPSSRVDISSIKVEVPQAWHRVVDRAIQVWGAAGFTDELPLAQGYLSARMLRIADGPDEVHRIAVAKAVLKQFAAGCDWVFG
jgi:acyl-CoA dehydrogenase